MSILITGGSGYIARAIKNLRTDVLLTDKHNYFGDPDFYIADLTNINEIEYIFKEHDISAVIHLAALKSVSESKKNKSKYIYNNVTSTLNLVKICEPSKIPIVFASTAALYASPNPYSISKEMGEKILEQSNLPYISLRYYNIGGLIEKPSIFQKENIFDIIRNCYNNKTTLTVNRGSFPRDYSHILDIAQSTINATHIAISGVRSIFDINSGFTYSVEEILDIYKSYGINISTNINNIEEDLPMGRADKFPHINRYNIQDIVKSEIEYGLV